MVFAFPATYAQIPSEQPPFLRGLGDGGLLWSLIAIAISVIFALIAIGLIRRRRAKKKLRAQTTPRPALPAAQARIELPPSQAEAEKLQLAEQARAEAQALRERRQALAEAARGAEAQEQERLGLEARALKEKEEEAKREQYRAQKAAEREARERHRREQEEVARLRAEEEQRVTEEARAQQRAKEAEDRRRIEAQAGQTLAHGLAKTKNQGFVARLNGLFGEKRQVDDSVLGQLEEILFAADIGVRTASSLVETARDKLKRNELSTTDKMKSLIREQIARIVDLPARSTLFGGGPPHVVMVVGVNGSGKTTTIGKLAAHLGQEGKSVILAAGDTFRAAAAEQLDVWAQRAGAKLIKGKEGSDPGAVVFEAIKRARDEKADVVIADTAGRLHTKAPLMEELRKVRRVMDKALPGAPHEVLLVLDATNGQNAIQQAKQFNDAVGITAIALTKLDGTAKGGVIIGIADELKIPVVWVGVGEAIEDMRPFSSTGFVQALFD